MSASIISACWLERAATDEGRQMSEPLAPGSFWRLGPTVKCQLNDVWEGLSPGSDVVP